MHTLAVATLLIALLGPRVPFAQERTPQSVADELFAADAAFSDASARTDLVSGLSAMFRDDVTLFSAGRVVQGKTAAVEALRSNPDNLKARVRWMPIGGGVSADAGHGFTFGFMLAERDAKPDPAKYLAYWIKGSDGWRVAVYKRVRAAGDSVVSAARMSPSLPPTISAPVSDPAAFAAHRESLGAAERAFSNDAQAMGLGPAFAKYGHTDAINLGGASVPTFVIGNAAIGDYIGEGSPQPKSPVSWAPEKVIVASTGDLGVTIGTITQNAPEAGASAPRAVPFFTIWRRARPSDSWKYIAE